MLTKGRTSRIWTYIEGRHQKMFVTKIMKHYGKNIELKQMLKINLNIPELLVGGMIGFTYHF